MLSVYPACFYKEDNGYSVLFPDLNNLATCGSTLEEAMNMAIDCLAGFLYTSQKDNDFIPAPSLLNDIDLKTVTAELEINDVNEGSFITMVSVDVSAYAKEHFEKSVKKTLTIPAWLNKAALEQNINFSQVLQEALISKIQAK